MSKKNGNDRHQGEMEKKFADFDRMIAEAKKSGIEAVMVPSPQTLGDTYEELIRNLTKLQEAELTLVIVPRPKK
jgi:dihydrodipicolinate synthase/N-acetylneuraminate lyase